jgi:hypothetical protein
VKTQKEYPRIDKRQVVIRLNRKAFHFTTSFDFGFLNNSSAKNSRFIMSKAGIAYLKCLIITKNAPQ